MIRINLLPVKQKAVRQFGRNQLVLGVLAIGIELVILGTLYRSKSQEVADKTADAQQMAEQVETLEKQSEAVRKLNDQKAQLEGLADVLGGLEANRAGPVEVMDELKAMLNRPANDLQRVAQERRDWATNWEPKNLWLTKFEEEDGDVAIEGKALSNDDVAEFAVRLANSDHFSDVRLERTSLSEESGIGAVFKFDIKAVVTYGAEREGSGEDG